MLFTATVTVAAGKTEANASDTILKIAHGIIRWVSIDFPPGCEGLAHSAVYHHEHRIFPSTESMSINGDRFPVEWVEYYEVYQPPYELKLRCWNLDDTYEHKITARVAILPRKAVLGTSWTDSIRDVIGAWAGALNPTGGGGVG